MGFMKSILSGDKVSWFNCVPFQRNESVKIAVTTKSMLIPWQTTVSDVTAF